MLVHFYVKFLMYIYDFLKMSLINITYQLLNYYVKRGESPKRSCTTMRRGGGGGVGWLRPPASSDLVSAQWAYSSLSFAFANFGSPNFL